MDPHRVASQYMEFDFHSVGSPPSRALLVQRDGTFYLGRRYTIYRSQDDGVTWSHVATIPPSVSRRVVGASRLAGRLMRYEVRAMASLSDGAHVAATREGVYYAKAGDSIMSPSTLDEQGQKPSPPMAMTLGPSDRVIWGEYNTKKNHNLPIRLFVSDDGGKTYQVAHVFRAGSVRHIHSLIYDSAHQHYWVLAGDTDQECGIGRLSADLQDFTWIGRGDQQFRAAAAMDCGDFLLYGMDSGHEMNAVMRFHKASGRVERLRELDGCCIYACRFGDLYVLSTAVTHSGMNKSHRAALWISRGGEQWQQVLTAKKDRWHPTYFQYGTFVLPRGQSDNATMLFSGQALNSMGGKAFVANVRQSPG